MGALSLKQICMRLEHGAEEVDHGANPQGPDHGEMDLGPHELGCDRFVQHAAQGGIAVSHETIQHADTDAGAGQGDHVAFGIPARDNAPAGNAVQERFGEARPVMFARRQDQRRRVPKFKGLRGIGGLRHAPEFSSNRIGMFWFPRSQGDIGFVPRQVEECEVRSESHLQSRVPGQQGWQARDDEPVEDAVEAGEPHRAFGTAIAAFDPLAQRNRPALDLLGMVDRPMPGIGRQIAGRHPVEKARAKIGFDHRDPPADGRRIDTQGAGGTGQRAGTAEGEDEFQVIPVHGLQYCSLIRQSHLFSCRSDRRSLGSKMTTPAQAYPPGAHPETMETKMTDPTAVMAQPHDQDRAVASLVAAFVDDPFIRWMFPDARQYLSAFPRVLKYFAGGAFEQGTAWRSTDYHAAAFWLPPGVSPDEEGLGGVMQDWVEPALQEEAFGVLEQVGKGHPDEAHWYLPAMGVDPRRQGKGYGAALLQASLAACDEAHVAAYLESTNPDNLPFYRRFGFDVIGEIQAGGSPVVTRMLRMAR